MTYATAPIKIDDTIPAMRLLENLPESISAEVIYGKLYILPSPKRYHQKIAADLFGELWVHAKETNVGEAYIQRTGVYLNDGSDAVEPDVIFIRHDNHNCILDDKGLFGPPDLIIEVLSSNKKHDLITKKKLYEQTCVQEYWIINPDTKSTQGYLLENNKYGDPLLMNSEIYIRILKKSINF